MTRISSFVAAHIRAVRYVAVGLTTVATDAGLLWALAHFGVPVLLAATVSFWVSLVVNFSLSKIWTFEVRQNTPHQAVLYTLLICWNYGFGLFMIDLFLHYHWGYIAGKLVALFITTGWNYFLYRQVIFVKTPSPMIRKLLSRQRLNPRAGEQG